MHRYAARWALYLTTWIVLLFSTKAHAWVEWHHIGEEIHIELDSAGAGRFEHALRYRVQMGPLKFLDLAGVDADAEVEPAGVCRGEDGSEVQTHVEALPLEPNSAAQDGQAGTPTDARWGTARAKKTLRVTVDDPKGLKRGVYTFLVRYRLSAVPLFARDGAMFRFTWVAPAATEGYDTGKVVLRVPSAPSEPKLTDETSALTTIRREATTDEVSLTRPHVARGEAVPVSIRLDPRAFPMVDRPDLRPRAAKVERQESRLPLVLFSAASLVLGACLLLLLRARGRVGDASLVPFRFAQEFAAISFSIALLVQALVDRAAGLLLLALPIILSMKRAQRETHEKAARPLGRWLALRDSDAFGAPKLVSLASNRGRALFVALAILALSLAVASARLHPDAPILICVDACVLLLAFAPGASDLRLRALRASLVGLRKSLGVRVVPWARLASPASAPSIHHGSTESARAHDWDELRLRLMPKSTIPGVLAVEVACGLEYSVLARLREGSSAEKFLRTRALGSLRLREGQTQEERVLVLSSPSAEGASAIVHELCVAMRERRTKKAYRGKERRNSLP